MTTTSEKWEDFRGQPVGDREEEEIGCLHAEVLACHGLVSFSTSIQMFLFGIPYLLFVLLVHLYPPAAQTGQTVINRCCLLFCMRTLCLCHRRN